MPLRMYLLQRIVVDDATGCWNWTGSCDRHGYGRINRGGGCQRTGAHRASYAEFVGPIPDGFHVHHNCRNPRCLNPAHLAAVSPWEHNIVLTPGCYAYEAARQTHCKKGHPLSGDNLSPTWLKRGKRICRICLREREHRSYRKNREKKAEAHKRWRERNREYVLQKDRERYYRERAKAVS